MVAAGPLLKTSDNDNSMDALLRGWIGIGNCQKVCQKRTVHLWMIPVHAQQMHPRVTPCAAVKLYAEHISFQYELKEQQVTIWVPNANQKPSLATMHRLLSATVLLL